MKALILVLPVFLFVFFLGCQETSLTDPGTIDANSALVQDMQSGEKVTSKDLISSYPRLIVVNEQIFDPTHPASTSEPIKGVIRYDHKLVPVYSTPGHNQYRVQIRLYVDMIVDANCPLNHGCMKVTASSSETIDFSGDQQRFRTIEKSFNVANTCCGGMKLILKFKVDKKDMTLKSMNLKRYFSAAGNSDF